MNKFVFYIIAIVAGIFLSIEGAIYAVLGDQIGKLESSLYNFAIGSIILAIALLFLGKGSLSYAIKAPKWELTGGLLGVIYLTVLVITIPIIGVGLAMGSVVVGQMIMSAVIEHFGLLGSEKKPLRIEKIIAIILMIIALTLIY
ncbi:DMT family transporter [Staphylococcus sp. ACRSN]|mgnify:CR=1 FL=1|uniref:DMT family transporter n=1 Tax=Staphylococcus sp. ACRSN TaxID=2918214 RepID=UPI001EF2FFC7|nr:DMT family transporter [Staphylococcus sp. ACRSN]MCG7337762.1 DMT family transporter [Staphylococcus sp. ACRSN]